MQHAVLEYLLNAGWQLALVAAVALVLSRLLKLAPAQSCRLWLAAYGLAVLAPLLAVVVGESPAHSSAAAGLAWLSKTPAWNGVVIPPWMALVLGTGFWLCLACAAARLLVSNIIVRRFVAASTALELPDDLRVRLEDFCRNRGHALPQIRCCGRISSPVVTGMRRPRILVPPSLLEKGPDELRAALLHELAHVVRGDYAANILVEVLALPLTWHPALHVIKAMIRLTREQSCDAIAAAQLGCRQLYARSLLSLARQAIKPQVGIGAALGMFGEGDLRSRIALLAAATNRRSLAGLPAAGAVAAFLLLGTAVTTVHLSPLAPPAPPRLAHATPARPGMSVQHVAAAKPVRVAVTQQAVRRRRSHARGVTDSVVALQPAPPPNILASLDPIAPEVSADDSGSGGIFDFALPLQVLKYRTVAP